MPHTEGPYAGATFALLTMHEKERILAPRFSAELRARVVLAGPYDTDRLGTFTRETPRAGSQLEAARRKAELACDLTGSPLGLGSEGSFAPGPFGFGSMNREIVVLVDRARSLEIVGGATKAERSAQGTFTEWTDLEALARELSFPEQGLVLRPDGPSGMPLFKEARDFASLATAFVTCRSHAHAGEVFVERDRRAHRNPERRRTIASACDDLLSRLRRACPRCEAPGFGVARRLEGLRCRICDAPTGDWYAEEWRCVHCKAVEQVPRMDSRRADPTHCPFCNP